MINSNLSTLMGSRRLKVIDVARELGVNRSSIDLLYNNQAKRVDLETLDKLCKFFECTPNDILNFTNEDK
ncbi:helix-turn-helix domain-containing protein [Thiomicrorhabdus sediminis]|uniref:Helix-turn-helix transcriptional regulator n=1 Tax=Thiomicrorhabdus sediminis TaxID=2580412 RepID=A0A4P9K7E2_9GAMM|nr:helix-turn-helix transcriptional regulator [Thiomicrorhabdus sediminis]QCU91005.1 helix-turn-helix transcriptional regulator [Thiomicrorhabdus sediminis]